jgi:hypothetical protein
MQEDPSLTRNWQKTVRVAVTGASGQIANHLLFMVSQLSGITFAAYTLHLLCLICAGLQ